MHNAPPTLLQLPLAHENSVQFVNKVTEKKLNINYSVKYPGKRFG